MPACGKPRVHVLSKAQKLLSLPSIMPYYTVLDHATAHYTTLDFALDAVLLYSALQS